MLKKSTMTVTLLCLFALVVSCGEKQPTQKETKESDSSLVTTTDAETEAVIEEKNVRGSDIASALPTDLDFGGASVTLLSRSEDRYLHEFEAAEDGEVVNDAIIKRNRNVSETLNIDFHVISRDGQWGEHTNFMKSVSADIMADSKEYDVISFYAYCNSVMASESLLMNLYDLKYIDFEKPWYHQMYIDSATVYEKLYAITGDINLTSISMLDAVYFNKNKLNEYYPDINIYEMVLDGKWTMDAALGLTKDVYMDIDGDGKESEGDFYGFDINGALDLWPVGMGLRYTKRTEDGGYMTFSMNGIQTSLIVSMIHTTATQASTLSIRSRRIVL